MSKLDKNQRMFARSALRRASTRWPPKNEAMASARIERGIYACAKCAQHFRRKEIQVDHKDPVIPLTGSDITLDEEAQRLFVYKHGYQILCLSCHKRKSAEENNLRRLNRKAK